jgi:hypothetical protein
MRIRGLLPVLCLAACAELAAPAAVAPVVRPKARPAVAALPAPGARTAEEFDTTTAAEREAAAAPAPAGEAALGRTVASLGDPSAPGFWLETPLVSEVRQGRVRLAATGASVQVELRPIPGAATAGSRLSLAAMRLLGVGLTDLPEIEVYAG